MTANKEIQKQFDNKDVVKKINEQLKVANNQVGVAQENIRKIKNKIQSLGCYTSSTMFGSSLRNNVSISSDYRYHLVKWQYALLSAKRRVSRFSKLTERISNRKC